MCDNLRSILPLGFRVLAELLLISSEAVAFLICSSRSFMMLSAVTLRAPADEA